MTASKTRLAAERFVGTRFAGDGRTTLKPQPGLLPKGTHLPASMDVRRASARRLIEAFLRDGQSVHFWPSRTAWVLLEYATAKSLEVYWVGSTICLGTPPRP